MKKWITPVLLFAAVLLVGYFFQRFTLILQEYEGLFLATPDGWARALAQPLPFSGIVSDFLVQFYRDPLYGALISATLITLTFLLLKGLLSRLGLPSDSLAALGAGVLYVFQAHASQPKPAVFGVLVLLAAWLLGLLLPRRKARPWKADIPLALGAVLAASAAVVLSPAVQRTERFSRVKQDALYGIWEDLLAAVPPSVAMEDPELTPFALLALSGKGELGEKMFTYPVYEENDLDMVLYDGKTDYYTSLLFKACLYQYLGCYNEAVHNYYQWATQQSKGTSFIVLRRLVELYYLLGDYTLMEKYCRILEHSTLNGAYVRHFRKLAAQGTPHEAESAAVRAQIPVISHDPLYNLLLLESYGFQSALSPDRMLSTLLLRNQGAQFMLAVERLAPAYKRIPTLFQEAMLVWGAQPDRVEEAVLARYLDFRRDVLTLPQDALEARYQGTAFLFLSQAE